MFVMTTSWLLMLYLSSSIYSFYKIFAFQNSEPMQIESCRIWHYLLFPLPSFYPHIAMLSNTVDSWRCISSSFKIFFFTSVPFLSLSFLFGDSHTYWGCLLHAQTNKTSKLPRPFSVNFKNKCNTGPSLWMPLLQWKR